MTMLRGEEVAAVGGGRWSRAVEVEVVMAEVEVVVGGAGREREGEKLTGERSEVEEVEGAEEVV